MSNGPTFKPQTYRVKISAVTRALGINVISAHLEVLNVEWLPDVAEELYRQLSALHTGFGAHRSYVHGLGI